MPVKTVHYQIDEWLEELEEMLEEVGEPVVVRITRVIEPRDDAIKDAFVIGTYFDESGFLNELAHRCDSLDYSGMLEDGTTEAIKTVASIKQQCRELSEKHGVEVSVKGGRFTLT